MTRAQPRAARVARRLRRLSPASVPRAGMRAVHGWRDYRERQVRALVESNRLQQEIRDAALTPVLTPQPLTPPDPVVTDDRGRGGFWAVSPFYMGFTAAMGALLAWLLVQNLTRLSSVLTYVLVAVFITLALNPVVEWLDRRGVSRGGAVLTVFLALLGLLALVSLLVVPPIVSQTASLVDQAPGYVDTLVNQPWLADLDARYEISDKVAVEAEKLATDRAMLTTLFGGVLGAAGWVAGSLVGVGTSFILTLYLLATLPDAKEAAYRLVPRSRRAGVEVLAEEVMRRVGGYALGQGAVATVNALCSWLMMQVLGIPYAAMLAVLVGLLGLIPMVGATLGAVLVALAALTVSPTVALVVIIYYVIYQQVENYVIVPNVMRRTVSVPGAVTVVAVLVGGTLLGVLGALIAIPVAAGLLLLYSEVLVPRQERL